MQDNTIKLKDGRHLGFAQYGEPSGIPLFLFHGTPGSRVFKRFENASWIKKYGMRVITPERPGYGLSDPAPERTIKDWASDVEELADFLDLDRFHVTGGSGGGPYVLACAIHSPARVLSATLFSSGAPPEVVSLSKDMQGGNRIIFFAAKYAPFLLKRIFSGTANTVRKHPEKYWSGVLAKSPEWDRRIMEKQNGDYLIMHSKEAFRQGVDGAYRDMLLVSHPWHLDLDKITVPVFMWHGTEDTLMPVSAALKFSKLIPGCETHFIKGAGHQLLGSDEIRSQMIEKILSVGVNHMK